MTKTLIKVFSDLEKAEYAFSEASGLDGVSACLFGKADKIEIKGGEPDTIAWNKDDQTSWYVVVQTHETVIVGGDKIKDAP